MLAHVKANKAGVWLVGEASVPPSLAGGLGLLQLPGEGEDASQRPALERTAGYWTRAAQ